jgi:ADP-heptose:LPS heptosyltransferase
MREPNFPHSPQRILLVRFSHLGDVVCALPLYYAIREAYPGARIAWATEAPFAPLLEGLPGLERVIRFDRGAGMKAVYRLCRELRAFHPDLSVDVQGNWKSSVAALASGAPVRLGLHPRDWRENSARHLTTDHAPPARGPHALQHAAALAEHLTGAAPSRQDPAVDSDEVLAAEALLEHHMPGDGPFLLVHLARPGDPRSWPEARYRELAREAAQMDIETLFLSGPDEMELGKKLEEGEPSVRHWVGQRGLRELAAVFKAAARRGAHILTCDSGPMHLAAACDLPVTLLAGPQDPRSTGPMAWGPLHSALRSPLPPACAPCKQRTCHHPRGAVCMSDLTAAHALDAVKAGTQGAISCA